jgi:pimeloyl-ACP methyl ester carboxylesterase
MFTITALSACGTAGAGPRAETKAHPARYASVNGVDLYYEVHGPESARPLVLLHGALSGVEPDFGGLIPELAKNRRVIAIEQQGHGHTADIERPFRVEHMAADTTALLDQLGVTDVDIMGYSMGALIALSIGLEKPDLVHKLVLVTPGYDNKSSHPGLMEGLAEIKPEMLHGSPFHDYYLKVAADPADFPTLVAKNTDMQRHYPNHPKSAIEHLVPPVLLVAGDSDLTPPEYLAEFFRLLGGGVMGDLEGLPDSQLAVLPGTTHLGVIHRPELHTIVPAFLDTETQ